MNTYKKGIAPIIIVILVLAGVIGGSAYYAKVRNDRITPPGKEEAMMDNEGDAMMKKNEVPVVMSAQNDSNQNGKATLTDLNGKTKVVVEIGSGLAGVAQPAHIHIGSCPAPGAVKYPLQNVVNGRSETMLDVALLKLGDELPLAINVHKSASEVSTYVSCGDLPMQSFETVGINEVNKSDNTTAQKGTTHIVRMTASGFSPASITIKKGDTVQFINNDTRDWWPASAMHPTHTVYPGSDIKKCSTVEQAGIFDACKGIAAGASWSFTFNSVGSWGYHDHLQASMRGTIVVE